MSGLEDLHNLIDSANWFSRLGEVEYPIKDGLIYLPNLEDWRDTTGILSNDTEPRLVKEGIEWLTTQNDEQDPIHLDDLKQQAQLLGKHKECLQESLRLYKLAQKSLRHFDGHPLLRVGPHDFTLCARGALLFAVRKATYEALLNKRSFWCQAMEIYFAGHWPLGLMPNRRVVVL